MAATVAATVRRGAPDCTSARIATSSKDAAADMALADTIPSRRGSEATRNSAERPSPRPERAPRSPERGRPGARVANSFAAFCFRFARRSWAADGGAAVPPRPGPPRASAKRTEVMAATVAATVRRGAPDCTSARIAASSKEDAAADMALADTIPSTEGRSSAVLNLLIIITAKLSYVNLG